MSLPVTIVALSGVVVLWQSLLSSTVPDPYLDEVFHVRQAQAYCAGDLESWDPKITTPPGLYLLSRTIFLMTGRCDINALRLLNNVALVASLFISTGLLKRAAIRKGVEPNSMTYHSALNISLFPPLFFFSGLYYTDVLSTVFVLEHFNHTLRGLESNISGLRHNLQTVLLGILSLLFRQTNIFWVAVFPAGLTVVHALKSGSPDKVDQGKDNELDSRWSVLEDKNISDAGIEDYGHFIAAVITSALRDPLRILTALLPHIFLLALFSSSVAWNGGVVLGDKSNHIATVHVPQLLYIWPFIFFFSFPLTTPVLIRCVSALIPEQLRPAIFERFSKQGTKPGRTLPRISVLILFLILGELAVHFNTIVHPFTLADNRHYVFYVFRILLRHPATRYVAVPVYMACGWAVIQTLDYPGTAEVSGESTSVQPAESSRSKQGSPTTAESRQISFVIIWLAATTLSVITTPLVEPRYFIVPWAIWRIGVATTTPPTKKLQESASSKETSWSQWILPAETGWFLTVNAVTGYMFLQRGFEWAQEPGQVQRFMW